MVTLCLRVPYSRFFLWKLPNGLEKTGAWEGKNERRQPAGGQELSLIHISEPTRPY